jgi:hypothetical protein
LLFWNACEEAAPFTESAPLGRWGLAEITRLKLSGGAIDIEIQDPFSRQIAEAVLPNFLAGCEHHRVELDFDRAFQLALRRLAE